MTEGAILIEDGVIARRYDDSAAIREPDGFHTRYAVGLCLAPGIVDIGVKVSEPGERHKESFRSAGLAAAAGGVTTMVTRPDTRPPSTAPKCWNSSCAARRRGRPSASCPWPR